MAVEFRVGQTVDADARVEEAVTTIVERQDHIPHPEVQGFMLRSRARSLMHMDADVQGFLRTSAEWMDDIVREPYARYAPPTLRPLTLREHLFRRTGD
jgi:hypothetical protein